ncbi:putative protein N(5)-glutamine methyltransferase [Actinoalloteichus hymeniacidonis]|uniref:peptide chain release factor N(5)-glutamine methyltransferase n=1 Tax=Actinoalloteichus hymeniacidonis TaxID=340345 RepID=A0AAC9HQC1_9PSEU|nr:putative protein N(5)-glutamine methyltransferase [Actinoalloteichus hymeniacidonis]AOS63657.1 putative protein-(glutamine-N5) methyltransferase, unknown substrate-specific [Actinoalloteichus hymeniacidonis]MBB5908295.1 release factor glutamine methyltransferase [Actinoalloteichus hymeniacidonis]
MSTFPEPPRATDIVERLRAAGCVFAEDEARLLIAAAEHDDELDAMVRRRTHGMPLEYVLGWAEFRGLRIAVEPGVFVPRRRTEFLVEQAIESAPVDTPGSVDTAKARARRTVVVDLCCGSGAVGVALAADLPSVELHAADLDPVSVRCARRNMASVNGGRVYEGDLDSSLPHALRGGVDILVANVPYVPTDAVALLPPEARDHEPRHALDGGADGLDMLRRVAALAPAWLAPAGALLIETSAQQASRAVDAFEHHGLATRVATSEALNATVVIGTRR